MQGRRDVGRGRKKGGRKEERKACARVKGKKEEQKKKLRYDFALRILF